MVQTIKNEINAILAFAYRDLIKFVRNKPQLLFYVGLPLMLVWVVGSGVQLNLGEFTSFYFPYFVYTGVIGQTLFHFSAYEVTNLLQDRISGLSQEIFVATVSRYSIILGKILGVTFSAFVVVIIIVSFGYIVGLDILWWQLIFLFLAGTLITFMGGAFGVILVSWMKDEKMASMINNLVLGPQFFLAGVFAPVKQLSPILLLISRLSPMTYAVDFVRHVLYASRPEYEKVILFPWYFDVLVIIVLFAVFIYIGTRMFVRSEKNR